MTSEQRRAHLQQIGSLGGATTVERHGVAWMRTIAAAGFQVTCDRHFAGNRGACLASLRARGRHFSVTGQMPGLIR